MENQYLLISSVGTRTDNPAISQTLDKTLDCDNVGNCLVPSWKIKRGDMTGEDNKQVKLKISDDFQP